MSSPPANPVCTRPLWLREAAFLLCLVIAAPCFARQPDPPQRIPLEPFGFQTISSRYLLEGATMLTVDYVDAQHLLVTFGISRLMPRLADCPIDDQDRTVKAVLLEVSTGRELAHTEWRFHDLGQYLWSLGDGHFLLRKRDTLSVISPLQDLPLGDAFADRPFLHFDRRIQAIVVSASHDLLSVESTKRVPPKPIAQTVSQPLSQSSSSPPASNQSSIASTGLQRRDPNAAKPDRTPTQIDFFGLAKSETSAGTSARQATGAVRILPLVDGRIYTSAPVNVPLTPAGFLRTRATTRDGVLLDFLTFTGKDIDLGDFATSCPPRPTFVSSSEFVAFGCRGSAQALDLAGFNLHGDFLWQIDFADEQAYPSFASSVTSGRFAFSRTVTSSHVFGNETPSMSQLQAQEVRVIQMYNGKQLLKVVTSPIQRAGQNFTLSPDGLSLAVIHDNPATKGDAGVVHQTSIEIYKLPPVSDKDQAQLRLEAALAPAPAGVRMNFSADDIKQALAARPDTAEPNEPDPHATSPADSRIAGDSIPPPAPAGSTVPPSGGTVPTSAIAPACSTLTDPTATSGLGCPATSATPAAAPPSAQRPAESARPLADPPPAAPPAEERRKPPTLYEPAPPAPPQ